MNSGERSRRTRAGLIVAAAFLCAIVVQTRVYRDFDRVHVQTWPLRVAGADGTLTAPLPVTRNLAGDPAVVILRLRNGRSSVLEVDLALGGVELGRVQIGADTVARVVRQLDEPGRLRPGDRLRLRAARSGWTLESLEIANVYGFSTGWFSFVVTPAGADRFRALPTWAAGIVFLLVLAVSWWRFGAPGSFGAADGVTAGLAGSLLLAALALPMTTRYQWLLSESALGVLLGVAYAGPVLARVGRWLGPVSKPVGVLARGVVAPGWRGRRGEGLVSGLKLARAFILWPARAASSLVTHRKTRRRVVVTVVLVVLGLIVIAMGLRSTPHTVSTGDRALLETYSLHALSGRLLVGPYSRFQWHHPGPFYFYLQAPLYALSGEREYSLDWTALLLAVGSALALVALMTRFGGRSFGVATLIALSVYLFRGGGPADGAMGDLLSNPWNPHVPILPLGVVIVLAAGLAGGHWAALPWLALVGSFVVQTHIGMAPVVVATVLAAGLIVSIVPRGFGRTPFEDWNATGYPVRDRFFATVWVLGVLWVLPLVEQIRNGPNGNLVAIAATFSSEAETPSLVAAFAALSYAVSAAVRPETTLALGGIAVPPDLDLAHGAAAIIQLVVLGGAAVWAVLTRQRFALALSLTTLLATGVALWSVMQVRGVLRDYLVFWMSILGVVSLATVGGMVTQAIIAWWGGERRLPSWAGRLILAAFTAVLVVHGASYLLADHRRTLRAEGRFGAQREAVRVLAGAIERELAEQGGHRPLVRMHQQAWGVGVGVVLQLYKSGRPVAVEQRRLHLVTDVFAETGDEDIEFLVTHAGADNESVQARYRLVEHRAPYRLYSRTLAAGGT